MTLLDIVLFLPLIGFLLLLLIPKSNPSLSRMAALVISLVIFVVSLGLLIGRTGSQSRRATRSSTDVSVDQLSADPLSRRPRRPEPVAGAADDAADARSRCWFPGSTSIIA